MINQTRRDGQLQTSLYDKTDDFYFHFTNFLFLSSNIPSSQASGVLSHISYGMSRLALLMKCFILRSARLSSKLLGQGYVREHFKSSLRKFYGRYWGVIKHYEVSLSQMLHAILEHDNIQWHPPLIRHYTNLWTYYRTGPNYWNWHCYQISGGFHRTLQRLRLANRGRLLLRTHGPVSFRNLLMLRPFSPELVMFSDFEFRTSLGTSILLYFIGNKTIKTLEFTWYFLHFASDVASETRGSSKGQ